METTIWPTTAWPRTASSVTATTTFRSNPIPEGRDYAQHYWFMHGLQQIRPGSELAIAWVASITRLKPHQVFMPTILFLSMMQIFALCAVAVFKGRHRKAALIGVFLFATSPLFGLGTLYQLIAQVAGISILLASASVLLSNRFLTWRKALLGGLITGAMGIVYPEVSPFVALSIILFALRLRYSKREEFGKYTVFIIAVAVLTPFLFIADQHLRIHQYVGDAIRRFQPALEQWPKSTTRAAD